MNYVKVLFLKEVGAFVGSDGRVYGPYSPRDEAEIPEEDARALALKGAVAIMGGYVVGGEALPDASSSKDTQLFKPLFSPLMLMFLGFILVSVGFIVMSLSTVDVRGWVWYFPLPPVPISGSESILMAILPLVAFLALFVALLYLFMKC
ncbi:MAG: hypothetical protein QW701_03365 [Candidatus Nezhaarchaeales archaeon]